MDKEIPNIRIVNSSQGSKKLVINSITIKVR